jgi:hypothetical protein
MRFLVCMFMCNNRILYVNIQAPLVGGFNYAGAQVEVGIAHIVSVCFRLPVYAARENNTYTFGRLQAILRDVLDAQQNAITV